LSARNPFVGDTQTRHVLAVNGLFAFTPKGGSMDDSKNTKEAYERYAQNLSEDGMIPMSWEEWKDKMDKQDEAAKALYRDARKD
jgi:gamma-glutamyl:cysteine ligase YbdK (ATP-grasp superfamily)